MRFAITVTDRYLAVFQSLVERVWTPVKVFTTEVDNRLHHNKAVMEYARRLNLDVQISRLSDDNLRQLADRGCEVLVVASYRWRIGDWRPHLRYAVNFHPSPLPEARGPWPLVRAIKEGRKTWGLSCHKLAPGFDEGDVLAQYSFPMDAEESQESLDLRCQLGMRGLAARYIRADPTLGPLGVAFWDALFARHHVPTLALPATPLSARPGVLE